jgi:hypothetical protein
MNPPLPEPAIVDPGRWGVGYTADQMHAYAAACREADREAMQAALQAMRRAVLALAFAAESSAAMADDYEALSTAITALSERLKD